MRIQRLAGTCVLMLVSLACAPEVPDDLPGLMDAMGSNDMRVQWAATDKVKRLYGVDGLLEALRHPNPGTRGQAAHWLSDFEDPPVQVALLEASADEDPHVRMWAVFSLGDIGDRHAVPTVVELLDDPEEIVRIEARDAVKKMRARLGQAVLPPELDEERADSAQDEAE